LCIDLNIELGLLLYYFDIIIIEVCLRKKTCNTKQACKKEKENWLHIAKIVMFVMYGKVQLIESYFRIGTMEIIPKIKNNV